VAYGPAEGVRARFRGIPSDQLGRHRLDMAQTGQNGPSSAELGPYTFRPAHAAKIQLGRVPANVAGWRRA
jgi:hypothetical protein